MNARASGKSTHGFILEAIAEKAQDTERASEFQALADQRMAEIAASGKTIPWARMRAIVSTVHHVNAVVPRHDCAGTAEYRRSR